MIQKVQQHIQAENQTSLTPVMIHGMNFFPYCDSLLNNDSHRYEGRDSPQSGISNPPRIVSSLPNTLPGYSLDFDDEFENEPPLLEELGIRFDHIWNKTQAVLYPMKTLHDTILDDADLAGPVSFCLLLGICLLLSGKVHFGYIYGFSVFGCLGIWGIINLLHHTGLDVWRTCSVLGYCLLPVIVLAAVSIFLSLKGIIGTILSIIVIAWSTFAAARYVHVS